MWREYFLFELKFRLKQPLFWISCLVLLASGVILVSTDLAVLMTTQKKLIFRNAPYVLINIQIIMSALGLFVLTAFVADSVLRDFRLNTDMFFFSKPAKKIHYFAGRFLGSSLMSVMLFVFLLIGFLIAAYVPWQDPSRLGPLQWRPLLFGFTVMVLPTMMALGALLFAVAVMSRRLLVIYLFVLAIIIAQDVAEIVARGLDNQLLGGLMEPFGLVALDEVTRYWTVAEFNTKLPGLSTGLFLNRLAWLAIGGLALILAYFRFQPGGSAYKHTQKKKKAGKAPCKPEAVLPDVTCNFTPAATWYRLLWQIRLETTIVLKSVPFLVLILTGMMFSLFFASVVGSQNEIPSYPLSSQMLIAVNSTFKLILPLIIIIYSGELIWREPRTATIEDVLPLPNLVFMSSKLLTIALVICITLASAMLSMVIYQLAQGFSHIEALVYIKGFLVMAYPMLLLAVAAVFAHTIASSKYLGHLLVLLLLISWQVLPKLGFENLMFQYGKFPPMIYSDFNSYGHYLRPFFAFALYWTLAGLLLFTLTSLIWTRGPETGLGKRLRLASQRLNGRTASLLGATLTAFVVCFIYMQSTDHSLSREQGRLQLAEYEKNYARYADLPLPRIKAVKVELDLFPKQRSATIKGKYKLVNESQQIIETIPVTMSPRFLEGLSPVESGVKLISLGGLDAELADERLGFFLYRLKQPLEPGAVMDLDFEVDVQQSGYRKLPVDHQIVANGSHLLSRGFFPSLGYSVQHQLLDPQKRADLGLAPVERVASALDSSAREKNYITSDWVSFEAIVSTEPDQVAITSGKLEREWLSAGRRYFHYKSQAPILNLQAFVSAKYEVRRESHHGLAIEIYYLNDHAFNIDRMMSVAKTTLDYATEAFGPYPHQVLRIVEVPNYNGQLAISLGSMITISESMGFNSRNRGIDPVKYVTAHEIAHHWWNHQVVSANVQGASMIGETLSEYTTLLVLEKAFGKQATLEWIAYKADTYLRSRRTEERAEMPLIRVENQAYIHYHKGLVVFNALRDLMGEDRLNATLRDFLTDFRFQGPPYPTAQDLLERFRDELPVEKHHTLAELFETVTLYDNRTIDATYLAEHDGRFRVDLAFDSRKTSLDQAGAETELEAGGQIEIGIYTDDSDMPTVLRSHTITSTRSALSIWVEQEPVRVGLDPLFKMLDRDRKDNFQNIQFSEGSTNAAN